MIFCPKRVKLMAPCFFFLLLPLADLCSQRTPPGRRYRRLSSVLFAAPSSTTEDIPASSWAQVSRWSSRAEGGCVNERGRDFSHDRRYRVRGGPRVFQAEGGVYTKVGGFVYCWYISVVVVIFIEVSSKLVV